MKKILIYSIVLNLAFAILVLAEDNSGVDSELEVMGRLCSITPHVKPNYIGIELFDEGTNMIKGEKYFYLDPSTTFKNRRSLDDIRLGDVVIVQYKEAINVIGGEVQKLCNTVTNITFLKSTDIPTDKQRLREEITYLSKLQEELF